MIETTVKGFARKMTRVAAVVETVDTAAIVARATVTKRIIIQTAERSSLMGRRFGRRFVKQDLLGKDSAQLHLQGGFGFLTELGSYKASFSGWDEVPKAGGQALSTPYGFFSKVDHPAIAAHPFWHAGAEAARKPGYEAWKTTMRDAIVKAAR